MSGFSLTIAQSLKKYNIEPFKKYGQNFILDLNLCEKIVKASHLNNNNNVLEVFDPVTGNEPHHDGLINASVGFIINVFYTGREFEFCISKIALHPAVFFPVPLRIDNHGKAIFEGQIIHFGLLKL